MIFAPETGTTLHVIEWYLKGVEVRMGKARYRPEQILPTLWETEVQRPPTFFTTMAKMTAIAGGGASALLILSWPRTFITIIASNLCQQVTP